MKAKYQHPIRTEIALVVAYPETGPSQGYAVLHAEGCSHAQRRNARRAIAFSGDESYGADDYFEVAPCAKAPKGIKK
jgi:hypothetical protein